MISFWTKTVKYQNKAKNRFGKTRNVCCWLPLCTRAIRKRQVVFVSKKNHCIPFFYEILGTDSLIKILKSIRCDKPNKIRRGPGVDQFAPIRVFEKFSLLSQNKYVCDFSLTFEEQLMPCKLRWPFIPFMPTKPDKYGPGIKFWVLVKAASKFIYNIVPYLGVQENDGHDGGVLLAESVVLILSQPINGLGYITCDNFFTCLSLVEKLQRKNFSCWNNKKNQWEVSKKMTEAEKGLQSKYFVWNKNCGALFVKHQTKHKAVVSTIKHGSVARHGPH